MPWHDQTPWRARQQKAKRQTILGKLEELDRRVRSGDMAVLEAIKAAYLVGFTDDGSRPLGTGNTKGVRHGLAHG